MKNLQVINVQLLLENDCDEQMVKEKFKKAEETTDQKFHGVSRRLSIVPWKRIMVSPLEKIANFQHLNKDLK